MNLRVRFALLGTGASLALTVMLAVGALPLTPWNAARAQSPEAVEITVRTTDQGFEPREVVVPPDSLIRIIFVWDHQSFPQEEHIMVLKGYRVESGKIDSQNRETTMEFISTQIGEFGFYCDVECELHDAMQNGLVRVTTDAGGGGGGGASLLTPTELAVDPITGVSVRSGVLTVSTTLHDPEGNPVSGAEIVFTIDETFAGVTAPLEIGRAETGEDGIAELEYQPTRAGAFALKGRFLGLGIYDASELIIDIADNPNFGPSFEAEESRLAGLNIWGRVGLAGGMLLTWSVFLFILWQAWSVRRVRVGGDG